MRLDKKKILETRERKVYTPSAEYLKQFDKCWIAQDDSGRILASNKNFDPLALSDEVIAKYHTRDFKLIYIDVNKDKK